VAQPSRRWSQPRGDVAVNKQSVSLPPCGCGSTLLSQHLREGEGSTWSPRTVIDWPDRHPWAAAVFAVPLTIVGLRGVAMHPSVFLPLLVLGGVALVVMACLAEHQAPIAATPQKRNRQSRANRAMPPAQRSRRLSGSRRDRRRELKHERRQKPKPWPPKPKPSPPRHGSEQPGYGLRRRPRRTRRPTTTSRSRLAHKWLHFNPGIGWREP
jgi:hypothetical protein